MNLQVHNPSDQAARVWTRNTRTGGDGVILTLEPGQTANVEISDEDHLVAAPVGESKPASGAAVQPPAIVDPNEKPAGADLVDAEDAQVSEILADMVAKKENLTRAGTPELPALNARLAEGGFNRVDGPRRDALFAALQAAQT